MLLAAKATACAGLVLLGVLAAPSPPSSAVAPQPPPLGVYRHVIATELNSAEFRAELARTYDLITIRGAAGQSPTLEGLRHAEDPQVFLYRRATAVSNDDAASLDREHQDWLARDTAGEVVRSKTGNAVIDITNPSVRRWLVDGIAADVQRVGYDGIYLDVVGAFFSERFYSERPTIGGAPLSDAAWREASIAVIREVKAATGKPVIANGFGLQSGGNYQAHRADADALIAAADGIQIEHFTRLGKMALSDFRGSQAWAEDVEFLRSVSNQGKLVLANTRVDEPGGDLAALERVLRFSLASFLVGAEGPVLFQFGGTTTRNEGARVAPLVEQLGTPLGPAYKDGDAMLRHFSGGEVAVNPGGRPTNVELAGQPVALAANEAAIYVGGRPATIAAAVPSTPGRPAVEPVAAERTLWIWVVAAAAAVLAGTVAVALPGRRRPR